MNLCKLRILLGIVIAPPPDRRFFKAILTHFHPLKNCFLYIIIQNGNVSIEYDSLETTHKNWIQYDDNYWSTVDITIDFN